MTATAGDFFEGVPTISSDDASVTCGTTESHLVDVSRLSTSRWWWWYVCGRKEARVDEPPPPPCVNDHVRTTTSSLLSLLPLSPSLHLTLSTQPHNHSHPTSTSSTLVPPSSPPSPLLSFLPFPCPVLPLPSLPSSCMRRRYCRVLRPRTQRLEQVVERMKNPNTTEIRRFVRLGKNPEAVRQDHR